MSTLTRTPNTLPARVGAPLTILVSWLRRLFWRLALAATGGLRVHGTPPDGPCVLVANHASHADTAALLAALPAGPAPRVAACADYWFGRRGRALFCRTAIGAFPMRRGRGGGGTDEGGDALTHAERLLAAGHVVIMYPEGTRTRNGELGRFRSGAARLARRAGVPMVPVGIAGTGTLLPVHGRLRRYPVTVRFGAPVTDLDQAWRSVARLRVEPDAVEPAPPVPDSRLRIRVANFAGSRAGWLTMAAWAVVEAIAWPLIPEFALAILCVAAPRRSLRLGVTAAAGSMVGGVIMYLMAAHGIHPPQVLTTGRMHRTLAQQVAQHGAAGLRHQAFSGIPFKVYGLTAGNAHVGLVPFLVNVLPGRTARIVAIGLLAGGVGALGRRWRRWYPGYLCLFLVLFTLGLAKVVTSWR